MSRRGRSGPAISLFAFQDIITSVTAIVLVVVLFLVLDLLQRKQATQQVTVEAVSEDLEARIAEIEAELEQLKAVTSRADAMVQEVAEFSPAELQADITATEQAIKDLELQQQSQNERHKALSNRLKMALAAQFDLRPKQEELAQTKRETRDVRSDMESTRKDPRIIFALPKGFNKSGWIAVIESDLISVAPLGRPAKPIEFRQTGISLFSGTPSDAFVKWIKSQELEGAYFLLLVRPGGATLFDAVDSKMSTHSIAHGFDVIDSQRPILHPEKGAAH
jgi:hypothetical protein